MGFRKPMARKQGLKFLVYGEDGSGKSVFLLTFPKIAMIDTESKVGVYENHPIYGKNLVAIADTAEYYDVIKLAEEVLKNSKLYSTFVTDSETNLYENMKVAAMEVEEEKAKKYGKNIDDAQIQMRGWGKVGLNVARYKGYKVQMSAKGMTVISVAHKKDVKGDDGEKKTGEKPDLKETAKHDADVVLRFFKKDGKKPGYCEVEKDTSETAKLGSIIENPCYDTWKSYIEYQNTLPEVDSNYSEDINNNKKELEKKDAKVESPAKKVEAPKLEHSELNNKVFKLAMEKLGVNKEETFKVVKNSTSSGNIRLIKDDEVLNKLLEELNKIVAPISEVKSETRNEQA